MNVPALIFIAISLAICGYGGWLFLNGVRSRKWPSVQGRITTSHLKTISSAGTGRSSFSKVLVLEYSYEVSGRSLSGSRIAMLPNGWFALGRPGALQSKYPAGSELPVYYDPAKPERCTLTRGVPGSSWSFYAIVGMFAFILLLALFNQVMKRL